MTSENEDAQVLSMKDMERKIYEGGGLLYTSAGRVEVLVECIETIPEQLRHCWRFLGRDQWNAIVDPEKKIRDGRALVKRIMEEANSHYANSGRGEEWRRQTYPERISSHDFEDGLAKGRAEAASALASTIAERDEARGLLAQNEAAMDKLLAERDDFRRHIYEIADVLSDETENWRISGRTALQLAKDAKVALLGSLRSQNQAAQLLGKRTAELAEVRKELEARRAADGMVGDRNAELEQRLAKAESAENGTFVLGGALDNLRKELGAGTEESTASAMLRVVRERDTALRDFESERKRAAAAIDYDAKVREALGAVPAESTLSAARRLEAERDRALESLMASSSRRESELQDLLDAIRSRLAAGDHETAVDAVDRVLHSHGGALEEAKAALRDQIEASGKTIGRLGGQLAEAEGQVTRIAEAVNVDADELAIEAVQRMVDNGKRCKRANDELAEDIDRLTKLGDEKAIAIARLKNDHQEAQKALRALQESTAVPMQEIFDVRAALDAAGPWNKAAVTPAKRVTMLIEERDEKTATIDRSISAFTAELDRLGKRAGQLQVTQVTIDQLKGEVEQRRSAHVKLHEDLHNLQVAEAARAQNAAVLQSKLEGRESRISELEQIIDANAAGAEARAAKLEAEVATAIRQRDGLDADLSAEQRKREQAEQKVEALTKGIGRAQSDKDKNPPGVGPGEALQTITSEIVTTLARLDAYMRAERDAAPPTPAAARCPHCGGTDLEPVAKPEHGERCRTCRYRWRVIPPGEEDRHG